MKLHESNNCIGKFHHDNNHCCNDQNNGSRIKILITRVEDTRYETKHVLFQNVQEKLEKQRQVQREMFVHLIKYRSTCQNYNHDHRLLPVS